MIKHVFDFFRTHRLEFVEKILEKDDIYTFIFRSKTPYRHLAGQHSLFWFAGRGGARPFSLASSPDEGVVKVGTHVGSKSAYKQAMMDLQPGDHLYMQGPYLDFIFPKQIDTPIIMVAQGIGITPFRSMLLWAARHQPNRSTHLVHVDRTRHTYRDETKIAATHAQYVHSPEECQESMLQVLKDAPNAIVYVSGSPQFIRSTTALLKQQGVKRHRIKKDGFLGY
jgi:ferredoxin-NADP reductase